MERVFLSWTLQNWLTVLLMGFAGYVLAALVFQVIQNVRGQSS